MHKWKRKGGASAKESGAGMYSNGTVRLRFLRHRIVQPPVNECDDCSSPTLMIVRLFLVASFV